MTELSAFREYALANKMELEAILSEIYTELVRGQDGFAMFDGGAHKGYHTLRMLALPGCERVIAVEADPAMASRLEEILQRDAPGDERVVLVKKALQRDPSVRSIPWRSSSSHQGRSSIVSGNTGRPTIWHGNQEMEYREITEVEAATIDDIVGADGPPLGFMKPDLEGADLHALFGARDTLARYRPVVAFENSVHAPEVHGFTVGEAAAYFHGLGYVGVNFVGETMGPDNWFGFFEAWAAPREKVGALGKLINASLARRGFK
ncbi:MAG: FkbM family methyltransferase [Oceanicaulis sp.]|nr:FkbM family methyltransferase [Oceanicaulis sp.]